MADRTHIEWTDATWNPVRGCSRVSPGCGGPNHEGGCYAEKIAARFSGPGQPFHGFAERTAHGGRWTGNLALIDDALTLPLRWKKPRRIFVNSMSDLFHENLPDEAIDKVFAVMALAPQHTFQVLTKRAERMKAYMTHDDGFGRWGYIEHRARTIYSQMAREHFPAGKALIGPLRNVWLGVSTENQTSADERIPYLLATPAAVRFISAEPLLGPIDLTQIDDGSAHREVPRAEWGPVDDDDSPPALWWNALTGERTIMHGGATGDWSRMDASLDWVIAGGESGPNARPMHPDWARSLRDQCRVANVPFFFKQWGEYLPVGQSLPGCGKVHGATAVKPGRMKLHYGGTPQQAPKHAFAERGVEFTSTADGRLAFRVGKKTAGRLLDGRTWDEFPTSA